MELKTVFKICTLIGTRMEKCAVHLKMMYGMIDNDNRATKDSSGGMEFGRIDDRTEAEEREGNESGKGTSSSEEEPPKEELNARKKKEESISC